MLAVSDVVFSSKKTTNVTVSDGQAVVFPSIIYDIGSAYDSTTGVFTTPIDGTYLFTARLCAYNRELINYAVVADGNDVIRGVHYGSSQDCASFNALVVLKSSSRVWVTCSFPGNRLHGDENRWNTFSGVLLH